MSGRGNLHKVAWAWVVAVVGEERISAGHDISWSAASEVGIMGWGTCPKTGCAPPFSNFERTRLLLT